MGRQARQTGVEALRIVAMLMVISMHYLQKGKILTEVSSGMNEVNTLAWLIEALCIGAANAYVLISGYFLVEGRFRWQKLVSLILQVWLYSVTIPMVCLLFGIGSVRDWNLYDWITVVLPLQSEHYWFATAYVGMYLFVPVLQLGVKRLEKRQYQLLLLYLLLYFGVGKSILPIALPTDQYGYDIIWFLCLFLIAAYIRIHGIPFLQTGKKALSVYLAAAAVIWLGGMGLDLLAAKGLPTGYMADMLYSYNHIAVLVLAVALLHLFLQLSVSSSVLAKGITLLAPGTFGVYLFHENIAIRHLWQEWSGIAAVRDSLWFLPHMLVVVILVFLIGSLVDQVRRKITVGLLGRFHIQ